METENVHYLFDVKEVTEGYEKIGRDVRNAERRWRRDVWIARGFRIGLAVGLAAYVYKASKEYQPE